MKQNIKGIGQQTVYGKTFKRCIACGIQSINLWRKKEFSYTQGRKGPVFHIWRCSHCKTGFLNPAPHANLLREVYRYSGHALTKSISLNEVLNTEKVFPNSTIDSTRMVRTIRKLDGSGNPRAIDVGSGYGFYTAALRSNGYKTISINPGHYENKVFLEKNGDSPIPVMFEDFRIKEKFGVVLMSQVLEHIVDPKKAVYKVSKLLSTGGIFACAVPNFNAFTVKILGTRDNACLWVPEHVNYFTSKGLSILLERHHLRIIKSEQITRIRPDALERRSSWVSVKPFLHGLVRYGQAPVRILAPLLRMGIYINIYARKG